MGHEARREEGEGIGNEGVPLPGGLYGSRYSGRWDHPSGGEEHGLLEKGSMDPLRFNVVRDVNDAFQGGYPWCELCLAKEKA